jgi:hypothetical protein
MNKYAGKSYLKRLTEVISIYDEYASQGVTNAYIYKNYIYPKYGIAERTFYSYLKNSGRIDEMKLLK